MAIKGLKQKKVKSAKKLYLLARWKRIKEAATHRLLKREHIKVSQQLREVKATCSKYYCLLKRYMEESARKSTEIGELKLQVDGKPNVDKMLDLEKQYARAIDDWADLEAGVAELKAKLNHRQIKVCHMHHPPSSIQARAK